jgi:predicted phosphodiesterase
LRYLILSDLHANREALEAVLADARGQYDRILCCGDIAGYGPDPNFVVEWSRQNLTEVIRGNHDRACAGLEDLEWFNPVARSACVWTMAKLTRANFDYLRALAAGPLSVGDFQLAHGSPLDEDEYLLSLNDARHVFASLETNLVFFGHTHVQGAFIWMDGRYRASGRPGPEEIRLLTRLDRDAAYLVNPGSVGQPRDGDPRAAYVLFDSSSRELLHCRIPYDWETTRRKIGAAGLPGLLGSRLTVGR